MKLSGSRLDARSSMWYVNDERLRLNLPVDVWIALQQVGARNPSCRSGTHDGVLAGSEHRLKKLLEGTLHVGHCAREHLSLLLGLRLVYGQAFMGSSLKNNNFNQIAPIAGLSNQERQKSTSALPISVKLENSQCSRRAGWPCEAKPGGVYAR